MATVGDCVEWQGARSTNGYGNLTVAKQQISAHRWAWQQTHGPIPKGMHVCHHCDNRLCINPEHLFVGTHQDNMNDARRKGRSLAKLTEQQVLEIRASTEKQRALADRYGVSQQTISRVRLGEWYTYVAGPRTQPRTKEPNMATVLKTRSIQFPEDLNDALTAAASDRQVSVNWLVGQLCREGLERLEPAIRVTT